MASLRDVFQHAGKRVQVLLAGTVRAEGKGVLRGSVLLVEAHLAPAPGEVILVEGEAERLQVVRSEPQSVLERVDHYRVEVRPVLG